MRSSNTILKLIPSAKANTEATEVKLLWMEISELILTKATANRRY